MRRKFRCPLACGRIKSCDCRQQCPSSSDYGRSVYVNLQQDLRFCTRIQRGSPQWKRVMKSRTSSERVNKRLLNDYALERYRARGKKRIFWWTMVHSVNILLDARLKAGLPSVLSFLELKSVAWQFLIPSPVWPDSLPGLFAMLFSRCCWLFRHFARQLTGLCWFFIHQQPFGCLSEPFSLFSLRLFEYTREIYPFDIPVQ